MHINISCAIDSRFVKHAFFMIHFSMLILALFITSIIFSEFRLLKNFVILLQSTGSLF